MFTFEVSELKEFNEKLKTLKNDLPNLNEQYLNLENIETIKKAKEKTPVDTGALRNSFKATGTITTGNTTTSTITNGQDYASFIEFGQRSYKGRYMLYNAIIDTENRRMKRYSNFFNKNIKPRFE
jgi:hypothetical protein